MKTETAMMELLDMLQVQNPLRNQMLEKEKQQIIDAFDGFPLSTRNSQNGEEYYNQTYKQD